MPDLPVELWDYIANLADYDDLLRLALVSRILLDCCRRIFARVLILDSEHRRDYDEMFTFLLRTNLVAYIENLFIRAFDPGMSAIGIPFESMLNLQHLMIGDSHFFLTADTQHDVAQQLKRCQNLRKLVYLNFDVEVSLPHDEFPIAGLRTLDWRDNGKLRPAFFSLCAASLSTIHCLMVHTAMPISEHDQYSQFFNFRFPVLEVLEIGPGNHSICGVTAPDPVFHELARGFSKFLIAHPTIKFLTLKYDDDVLEEAYLPFDGTFLSPNILPNLESLSAYPSQITQFVFAKAGFFQKLVSLSIRESQSGDMERILQVMFRAIQDLKRSVGPLNLRHLVLAFNDNMHDCEQLCKPWLDTCADAFPLLETYTGETFRSSTMYGQFPIFQHLRVLSCAVRRKNWQSQHAEAIAKNCPLLEKIVCYEGRRIFNVDRSPTTGEVSVRASSRDEEDVHTDGEIPVNENVFWDFEDSDDNSMESDPTSDLASSGDEEDVHTDDEMPDNDETGFSDFVDSDHDSMESDSAWGLT